MADAATKVLTEGLKLEHAKQLRWLQDQVGAWMPAKFMEEVPLRVQYVKGDMEDDLEANLQAEFSQSWMDMKRFYTMFPLVQHMSSKRAQTFRGKGMRFYLRHRLEGYEASADKKHDYFHEVAEAYSELIDLCQLPITLRQIDAYTEETVSSMGKVWWDEDHVRVSAYSPDQVGIAVNQHRYWDPYSAYGVLFRMPSAAGITGAALEDRFEVYASATHTLPDGHDESGRPLYWPTKHWVAAGNDITLGKDNNDANELKHWVRKERPLAPYTWFTTDPEQIYAKGNNTQVRLNQTVNMGLTYLQFNMSWSMLGIPVYERQPGKQRESTLPAQRLLSPKHALTLPPDVRFSFVRNEIPLERFTNTYEMFIQYNALLRNLAPRSMSPNGLPQSGIAMRIEMANLSTYRDEKVEVMRPQVKDLLHKVVAMRNAHLDLAKKGGLNSTPIDLTVWEPVWEPGSLNEGPVDYIELGQRYEGAIAHDVATADDWAAEFHGLTLEEAQARVAKNRIANQEAARAAGPDDEGSPERIFGPDGEEVEVGEEGTPPPPALAPAAKPVPAAAAPAQVPAAAPAGEPPAEEPEMELAKMNVYQLIKLRDADVISNEELRALIFGENPAEAAKAVQAAITKNLAQAKASSARLELLAPEPDAGGEGEG